MNPDSLTAVPPSHRSPSPEVAAFRAAAVSSCKQLRDQARQQARLIRSGAAGELTEADIKRMAQDITAAARAQLDAAAPPYQTAGPELQATRRETAEIMTAAAREAETTLRKAWQARQEKPAARRWLR